MTKLNKVEQFLEGKQSHKADELETKPKKSDKSLNVKQLLNAEIKKELKKERAKEVISSVKSKISKLQKNYSNKTSVAPAPQSLKKRQDLTKQSGRG